MAFPSGGSDAVSPPRLICITGTDTSVGKTLLTGLLLAHLRQRGQRAFALKPFCSGTRAEVRLLRALQSRELTLDEINPFFFSEPLAPLLAARKHHRRVPLQAVLDHIAQIAQRLAPHGSTLHAPRSTLLLEGAGGLLAPLGVGFSALDLIRRLRCETLIVSRNQLGTINHTLLTFQTLARETHTRLGGGRLRVVLMNRPRSRRDISRVSNARLLSEFLPSGTLFSLPFLGPRACQADAILKHARRLAPILSRIITPF